MGKYIERELVYIERNPYIYRVTHRIMEGDCQTEHGPILVEVGGFYADKYPVTNKMFYDFIKESGYKPADSSGFLRHFENGIFKEEEANLPVVNVSQEDAKAYAAYYSMRLPTDQEWQYMAAGPYNLKYPWGNLPDYKRCNAYGKGLTPVDAYPQGASPFGLVDMCGNAWEMTDDLIDDGRHRFILLRGGCYYRGNNYWHAEGGPLPNWAHLKMHLMGGAMDRNGTVGFRCVKDCAGEG
ncbi:ToxD protein [[Clostridium] cellulosi]|uniref:ToxD protein n=1 Tax=[Clostridium] cellulosi TaxID=29343 RepID=A0A078KRG9_9FIRM|nr:ToxD protein [[Clostridium] cellulosi]